MVGEETTSTHVWILPAALICVPPWASAPPVINVEDHGHPRS
ncbi:hypothetical protein J2S40_000100 [Nocardioides luteus]|nr:hypothetical protein [Nocardioides luteus]